MKQSTTFCILAFVGSSLPINACQTCVVDLATNAYPALGPAVLVLFVWLCVYAVLKREMIQESPKKLIAPGIVLFILSCLGMQAGMFLFLLAFFLVRLVADIIKPLIRQKQFRRSYLLLHGIAAILLIIASLSMYRYYYSLSPWERYGEFTSWGTPTERTIAIKLAREENWSPDQVRRWLQSGDINRERKAIYVLSYRDQIKDAFALEDELLKLPPADYKGGWTGPNSPHFRQWLDGIGASDVKTSTGLKRWLDEKAPNARGLTPP